MSMKKNAEDKRIQKIMNRDYKMQASWLPIIDEVIADDFTWHKMLYGYSERLLKFIINLRANTLPSPDNLRRWDRPGSHSCSFCGRENATLNHILNGCPTIRKVGKSGKIDRYT